MRRLFWTLTVVLLLFCPRLSQGCGDKLLILGRGLRFSALSADRPAAILAYAPEGSLLASILKDPQWIAAMNKGKHRLKAVQSMDELRPALSRERYDLVLLNLSDALKLKQTVQSAPSDPLAVPVVNASARDQVQTAEREYAVALKSDSKSKAYLSGISKAVELRDRRAHILAQARKSGKIS